MVYNGYVYEIGGFNGSAAVATVDYAPILSSGTLGSWTATTSLPVSTAGATSVVYGGFVYEIGGYNGSVNVTTVDYAPILSSGVLGSWNATTSLSVAIKVTTSVVYDGYVYEIGGWNGNAYVATVYYSSPLSSSNPGYFTVSSNINGGFSDIFSIDPYGNAIFSGTVTTGGTPADVAEEVIGGTSTGGTSTSGASPGDIVSASSINPASSSINNFVSIPTTHPYSNNMIGVISTNPSIILHQQNLPNSLPLALAGRVLVKVTNYNGNIQTGSMITGSTFAGYGELAKDSGQVVGIALNSLTSNTPGVSTFTYNGVSYLKGEILMLVDNQFYNPLTSQVTSSPLPGLTDIGGNINITGNTNISGNLIIGGHIIVNGSTPTFAVNSNAGIGASATLTNATQTSGIITLQSGTLGWKSGDQIDINFKGLSGLIPKSVIITPLNAQTALDASVNGVYIQKTDTGFSIDFANPDTKSNLYSWNYFVVQ